MDNSELSLTHFGHLFEVFGTYYLLLGTSKRFHDYFGISQIFKAWPAEYRQFQSQSETVKQMHEEWKERMSHSPAPEITTLKKHNRQEERKALKLLRAMNILTKIDNFNKKISRDIILHFPDAISRRDEKKHASSHGDEQQASIFYKFMRPFYIYFGTLAISLLVLGGVYDHWDCLDKLGTINLGSFIIFSTLIFFIIRKTKLMIRPTTAFLFSIIFLLVFVAFPTSWTRSMSFIPYISIFPTEHATLSNCTILTSVALVVFPILVHITALVCILIRHHRMRGLQSKLNNYISTPFVGATATTQIPIVPNGKPEGGN